MLLQEARPGGWRPTGCGTTWQGKAGMVVTPEPAATVILIRDCCPPEPGVEVLLVRRPADSRFAPGVFVFPGGRIEESDWGQGVAGECVGLDGEGARRRMPDMGPPEAALGAWVAAARETFEEVGILLACDAAGNRFPIPPALGSRLESHRRSLHAEEACLLEILRQEGLKLAAGELHYVAHWITPEASPIRYSVRFFLARAPSDQAARHDGVELIEHRWVQPRVALEECEAGTFPLLLPTRFLLGELVGFSDASEALRWARDRVVSTVLSRIVFQDGVRVEVLPQGHGSERGEGTARAGDLEP